MPMPSKQRRLEIRSAERLCRREIQALRLPPGLRSVADVAEHIAAERGRPIRLVGASLARRGIFGLWAMLEHEDVVLYERDTTLAHQEHIVAHELGHIILDHSGGGAALPLITHLPGELVSRVLCRCGAQDKDEVEAEVFADLLSTLSWSGSGGGAGVPRTDALDRIMRSLSGQ